MNDLEFTAYWTLLCERFGRTPSAPLTRIYATYVKAQALAAAEWAEGVQTAVIHETFMPSPQKLVDLARGSRDFETQALREWDECLTRVHAGESAATRGSELLKLINSATNHTPLGLVNSDQLPFVKRDFIKLYTAARIEQSKAAMPALIDGPRRQELPDASD